MVPQLFNVVRIGQAANIEYQIGFRGNAVLKPKGSDLDGEKVGGVLQKDFPNLFFQLGRRKIGGFNVIVGNSLNRKKLLTLVGNGIVQAAAELFVQRMLPASFLIALDEHLVSCLDIENLDIQISLPFQLHQHMIGICKHIAGAQIGCDCQLF